MNGPNVLIIIPAHNEEANLEAVIRDVRDNIKADIVVIDDGSTDSTARIAQDNNADLLQMPFNLGIGSTVQTGYKYACLHDYDIAVQVDGDGQHDASYLPALLNPLIENEADLTVGSRYLAEDSSYQGAVSRKLGTAMFSRILSTMLRQKITDATSGFRAANKNLIHLFAQDYPRDYPEVEALLQVHKARCRTREVPVQMRQRSGGQSSINYFRSIYYMVKVLLALLVGVSRNRASNAL